MASYQPRPYLSRNSDLRVETTLLQKLFLGAGKTAFVGAGAIPTPVFRSYKSSFLGAGKGLAPVNTFPGAGQGINGG